MVPPESADVQTRRPPELLVRRVATKACSERAATSLIFVLFALLPFVSGHLAQATTLALSVATWIAWRKRWGAAASLGLIATVASFLFVLGLGFPPLVFGVAICCALLVQRQVAWLPEPRRWLRTGSISRGTIVAGLLAAALSGAALVSWHAVVQPDTQSIYETFGFHSLPLPLLLAGAVLFSIVNAAAEEFVYRGFVHQSLAETFPLPAALLLQAAAFGLLHIQGFPSGVTGAGLAFVFGLMMGWIRVQSDGMLAPWAAHVAADLTIVGILLFHLGGAT